MYEAIAKLGGGSSNPPEANFFHRQEIFVRMPRDYFARFHLKVIDDLKPLAGSRSMAELSSWIFSEGNEK